MSETKSPIFTTQKSLVDLKSIKKKFFVTKPKHDKLEVELNDENSGKQLLNIDLPPNVENYRNLLSINYKGSATRPTLNELRKFKKTKPKVENLLESVESNEIYETVKFGWIKGVLIRCTLNIFGVIIFLRLSWVVGQCGMGLASLIILVAALVTTITTLSTSAICTNGDVKGGGAYFFISRSLGPELGGAIGIVFSTANSIGVAMNVIGFSETLTFLLKEHGVSLLDGGINDTRIYGLMTNCFLLIVALIGMGWEAIVQLILLAILILSFINFFIGTFLPGSETKQARGFVGYDFDAFKANLMPGFRDGETFTSIFGVFFPAVTGILAGANISGNLKNPQTAIPKGTMTSIVITSLVYLLFVWLCGSTMVRDAAGLIPNSTLSIFDCTNQTCNYGLMNNYQVVELISEIPGLNGQSPLIIAGVFAASLSSALASLIGAPKIFQAVAQDKIFPKIKFFAVGHGKSNEPWRGYFLVFFISLGFIFIGELNVIAPIISNFYLLSYALINFSCFDATINKAPGWRPSFKYYNKWVSLFGSLVCIVIMFLISWTAALVSFLVCITLYLYIRQRNPDINWGSSTQAQVYRKSLEFTLKLQNTDEHVKNFRPNFLVLTGSPSKRPALCDLCAELTKGNSLMVCANIIRTSDGKELRDSLNFKKYYNWMEKRKIKSFYTEVNTNTIRNGAVSLLQSVGLGKLRPNILLMGFKNRWRNETPDVVLEYFGIINDAFEMKFGVCILKLENGLDYSDFFEDEPSKFMETEESDDSDIEYTDNNALADTFDNNVIEKQQNIENLIETKNKSNWITELQLEDRNNNNIKLVKKDSIVSMPKGTDLIMLRNTKINKGLLQGLNMFHRKIQDGFVDVWWLFDDGGLTLLLPYLLLQRKYWKKCKLRIFIETKSSDKEISEEQRNIATFLAKFRIKFHDLVVFSLNKSVEASNLIEYESLIQNWRLKPNENFEDYPWKITDEIYKDNIDMTYHYLRLRELLQEYSKTSCLVVLTISVPNIERTSAALYLSWIDHVSNGMPPFLMVRGNQSPVLTFYS